MKQDRLKLRALLKTVIYLQTKSLRTSVSAVGLQHSAETLRPFNLANVTYIRLISVNNELEKRICIGWSVADSISVGMFGLNLPATL